MIEFRHSGWLAPLLITQKGNRKTSPDVQGHEEIRKILEKKNLPTDTIQSIKRRLISKVYKQEGPGLGKDGQ